MCGDVNVSASVCAAESHCRDSDAELVARRPSTRSAGEVERRRGEANATTLTLSYRKLSTSHESVLLANASTTHDEAIAQCNANENEARARVAFVETDANERDVNERIPNASRARRQAWHSNET